MNNKPTLGVVAISYNEERDLPSFLSNLLPWVDEIVIVDDGSKDRTKDLASGIDKVKFIESQRLKGQYYADQRNKGIDAAESDWLIHMDIDERISPVFAREVLEAIQSDSLDAYRYKRINYFLHRPMKGGGWADWNLVHLAKRETLRFSGMFHEEIHLSCADDRIGKLNSKIIHLNDENYLERLRKSSNYQHEVAASIKKQNMNLSGFSFIFQFIKEFGIKYIYKGGYKDGVLGLIWAFHAASAKFRSMALVWDELHTVDRDILEDELKKQWDNDPL